MRGLPVWLLLFVAPVTSQGPFNASTTCNIRSVLDTSALTCVNCVNKKEAVDGVCDCGMGFKRVESNGAFTCEECLGAGQTSWSDRSGCTTCSFRYDPTTRDCLCSDARFALTEHDENGQKLPQKSCRKCPPGHLVNPDDLYSCMPCPDELMLIQQSQCVCPDEYELIGDSCIFKSSANAIRRDYPTDVASIVYYRDIELGTSLSSAELKSWTFGTLFFESAVRCQDREEREACQTLGNLCVMQKYEKESAVCRFFAQLSNQRTRPTNGFTDWKESLPWLEYSSDKVLYSSELNTQYSLFQVNPIPSDWSKTSTIAFKLAKYDYQGRFLGLEDLTDQLQMCGGNPSNLDRWMRFGTNYENSCNLDLNELLTYETVFYDLYIVDVNKRIYPCPVKQINYREDDRFPNKDIDNEELASDTARLTLQRRFFLVDNVSGKKTGKGAPTYVAYAKKITLRVTIREDSDENIYPPTLVIEYAEREVSRLADGGVFTFGRVSFRVEYTTNLLSLREGTITLWSLAIALIVVLWFIKIYSYQKANNIINMDALFAFRAIVYLASVTGDVFFWLAVIVSGYCFVFFKGQAIAYFLLPAMEPGDEYEAMTAFIAVAFFGKFLGLVFAVWDQVTVDIFFVDWEKPQSKSQDVSVWRKMFIVNKWNELQVSRAVSIEATLFVLIFLLEGNGLKYHATAQPDFNDLDPMAAPIDPILRFFVSTFWWMLICMGQLVFQRVIFQRYYDNKVEICFVIQHA